MFYTIKDRKIRVGLAGCGRIAVKHFDAIEKHANEMELAAVCDIESDVLGEKGSVRVGGVAVNEIQQWEFSDQRDYDEDIRKASYETSSVYGFGHPLYYRNVVDVLRGRAEPETDGREGLKGLEVLLAIYLSARDSCTVALPLEY